MSNLLFVFSLPMIKSFEEYRLLIKGVSETIKNEAKNNNVGFSECYQVNLVPVNY